MRQLSREAREATGWTTIRVTRATRDELVMLLNLAQLKSQSREHERGGRQYGAKAELTIDDVAYYVASEATKLEVTTGAAGDSCSMCHRPHTAPASRALGREATERRLADAKRWLESRSTGRRQSEYSHTGSGSRQSGGRR